MEKDQTFNYNCIRYNTTSLIIILLALLNCLGCNEQKNQKENTNTKPTVPTEIMEISEYGDNLIVNQYKDGKKYGLWREYYDNGKLKTEGKYTADLKEGLHKEWQEDGVLLLEGFYAKGKANGLMKWYGESGHLAATGNMIDDIRDGKWKICDIEDTGFCIAAYFEDGKREGIWKINHEHANDKLWKEQNWKDDKLVAEKCWDESGKNIECE